MPLNPSYTLLGAVALAPSTWRRPRLGGHKAGQQFERLVVELRVLAALGLASLSDGVSEPLDAGPVQTFKAAITPYGQTQLAV